MVARITQAIVKSATATPLRNLLTRVRSDIGAHGGRCVLFVGVGAVSNPDDLLAHLSVLAGNEKARVLLIDTDSQAHATLITTGTRDYGTDNSLYTVLMADRQNAAREDVRERRHEAHRRDRP